MTSLSFSNASGSVRDPSFDSTYELIDSARRKASQYAASLHENRSNEMASLRSIEAGRWRVECNGLTSQNSLTTTTFTSDTNGKLSTHLVSDVSDYEPTDRSILSDSGALDNRKKVKFVNEKDNRDKDTDKNNNTGPMLSSGGEGRNVRTSVASAVKSKSPSLSSNANSPVNNKLNNNNDINNSYQSGDTNNNELTPNKRYTEDQQVNSSSHFSFESGVDIEVLRSPSPSKSLYEALRVLQEENKRLLKELSAKNIQIDSLSLQNVSITSNYASVVVVRDQLTEALNQSNIKLQENAIIINSLQVEIDLKTRKLTDLCEVVEGLKTKFNSHLSSYNNNSSSSRNISSNNSSNNKSISHNLFASSDAYYSALESHKIDSKEEGCDNAVILSGKKSNSNAGGGVGIDASNGGGVIDGGLSAHLIKSPGTSKRRASIASNTLEATSSIFNSSDHSSSNNINNSFNSSYSDDKSKTSGDAEQQNNRILSSHKDQNNPSSMPPLKQESSPTRRASLSGAISTTPTRTSSSSSLVPSQSPQRDTSRIESADSNSNPTHDLQSRNHNQNQSNQNRTVQGPFRGLQGPSPYPILSPTRRTTLDIYSPNANSSKISAISSPSKSQSLVLEGGQRADDVRRESPYLSTSLLSNSSLISFPAMDLSLPSMSSNDNLADSFNYKPNVNKASSAIRTLFDGSRSRRSNGDTAAESAAEIDPRLSNLIAKTQNAIALTKKARRGVSADAVVRSSSSNKSNYKTKQRSSQSSPLKHASKTSPKEKVLVRPYVHPMSIRKPSKQSPNASRVALEMFRKQLISSQETLLRASNDLGGNRDTQKSSRSSANDIDIFNFSNEAMEKKISVKSGSVVPGKNKTGTRTSSIPAENGFYITRKPLDSVKIRTGTAYTDMIANQQQQQQVFVQQLRNENVDVNGISTIIPKDRLRRELEIGSSNSNRGRVEHPNPLSSSINSFQDVLSSDDIDSDSGYGDSDPDDESNDESNGFDLEIMPEFDVNVNFNHLDNFDRNNSSYSFLNDNANEDDIKKNDNRKGNRNSDDFGANHSNLETSVDDLDLNDATILSSREAERRSILISSSIDSKTSGDYIRNGHQFSLDFDFPTNKGPSTSFTVRSAPNSIRIPSPVSYTNLRPSSNFEQVALTPTFQGKSKSKNGDIHLSIDRKTTAPSSMKMPSSSDINNNSSTSSSISNNNINRSKTSSNGSSRNSHSNSSNNNNNIVSSRSSKPSAGPVLKKTEPKGELGKDLYPSKSSRALGMAAAVSKPATSAVSNAMQLQKQGALTDLKGRRVKTAFPSNSSSDNDSAHSLGCLSDSKEDINYNNSNSNNNCNNNTNNTNNNISYGTTSKDRLHIGRISSSNSNTATNPNARAITSGTHKACASTSTTPSTFRPRSGARS